MKLDDLNIYDIGNKIGIVGTILGGDGKLMVCMFPDHKADVPTSILELDDQDWAKVLRQMDLQEVEVLQKTKHGDLAKMILRKSQRLIEQRVSWAVFKRDGYRCRYCGAEGVPLTVDHLVLWEEGGPSTENNLVASCRKCNKMRGNTQYADWLNSEDYGKVSANLTEMQKAANIALLAVLNRVDKRHSARNTRK